MLERGDNPENGGVVDVEMGGCYFFITLHYFQLHLLSVCVCVCWGGGGGLGVGGALNFPLLHFSASVF